MPRPLLSALLAAVAALLALPLAASAAPNYRVGIGNQKVQMFSEPAFQDLHLKRVRYIVPWDYYKRPSDKAEANAYIAAAQSTGHDLLITFTASRSCYTGSYDKSSARCKLPSVSRYLHAFKAFRKDHKRIRTYSVWNEINHKSQPTAKNPKRAAQYFLAADRECRRKRSGYKRCAVVAADVLDQAGMEKYVKKFLRYAKHRGKIWGLHNYGDVNRKRTRYTRAYLKLVKGRVWLTETGGILRFGRSFPESDSRQKSRTANMFKLADKYSKKRKGYSSRIDRLYPYSWTGNLPDQPFDAGLTDPDGTPRPVLATFEKYAKHRKK